MMYSILALGAVTLVAAANAKESDALPAITKCQITFAATNAGCNDIVDFGRCLAVTGIDTFPDESEVRQLAESMLISAQRGKDCKNYGDKDDYTAPKKATVRTTRGGGLEFNVEEGKDVNLFRFRRETISLFSVSERLTTAESALIDQEDAVKKVADDLSNYGTQVDKKVSAETETRKEAIAALTEELTNKYATIAKLGDATDDIKDLQIKIGEVEGSAKGNAEAIEALKAKVGTNAETNAAGIKANKDGLATLKTAVDKLVKLVPSDLGSQLADPPKTMHVWSGTPRSHNRGQNWHNFVLDDTDFDTAMPYFRKISATHFKVEKSGLYKMEVNMMTHTNNRCWAHFQINVAGTWINDSTHTYAYSWKQTSFTIMYPIKAGQQVHSRVYVQPNCGNPYVWHQGKHSRFQMSYEGQYATKCTGKNCIIPSP
jgi:hypothetical protein